MLADYHMHTSFSDDSNFSMENCINRAIDLGFDEICFTEHIDYGCKTSFCCNCNDYYETFSYYKQIYNNKINLKFGIEFGIQAHHAIYFQKIYDKYPFDFVLLSFHQIQDKELWNQDFQNGKPQAEYNKIYFEEILNTIQVYNDYSVLAHMDLMRRYDRYGEYPTQKSYKIIEQILRHLINHGKGIEVNTSSFRYKLNDLMPSRDILKLYKELGGEIITIGSDSHQENQVGNKIIEAKTILKSLGYSHFTTFDKMIPQFHKL